ncbi:MAG: helix-turn-helix domain-containing protein [Butyricicoccus sp.]
MTFGEKLSQLRKQNNMTQEQLAATLHISRQAISKWESDAAYPETSKIIQLSDLFGCSLDYLLKPDMESDKKTDRQPDDCIVRFLPNRLRERKSKTTIHGIPLWHIGKTAHGIIAIGMNARGLVAVGLRATGLISLGLLSLGLLSFGMLSLGLLSIGMLALGLVSTGCFAAGIFAIGSISFGILSVGAIAVGDFSVGALAIGKYFAMGDHARAMIAMGETDAIGSVYQTIGEFQNTEVAEVKRLLDSVVPSYLTWAKNVIRLFFL